MLILTPPASARHGEHPKVGHDRLRLSAAAARQKCWLQNNRFFITADDIYRVQCRAAAHAAILQHHCRDWWILYCLCNTAAKHSAAVAGPHLVLQEVTVDNQCSAVITSVEVLISNSITLPAAGFWAVVAVRVKSVDQLWNDGWAAVIISTAATLLHYTAGLSDGGLTYDTWLFLSRG